MVEKRKTMHSLYLVDYRDNSLFYSTCILFMAKIEKMGLFRNPVGADGKAPPTVEQYQRLWQEILQRGDGL